jgi:transcriptional regulator with XRE-family HTH domain
MLPTPTQIRAARALLNLTQEEAAVLVGISKRTWVAVEQGVASADSVQAVMGALMGAGIEFLATKAGRSRGVRLRD